MASQIADQFGRNLWRSRRRADLTQQELALRLHLHRTEISGLERGLRIPRLDTILKLSAGVEVSPCVLLAGLHWRPGYWVEGDFYVEDGSQWAAGTEQGDKA